MPQLTRNFRVFDTPDIWDYVRRSSIETTDGNSPPPSPFLTTDCLWSAGSPSHDTQQGHGDYTNRRPTVTLAELFSGQWDPSFRDYVSRQPATATKRRIIPTNQLPTVWNNYSISNFTIETILSLGIRFGYQYAELAIDDLLQNIPPPEKASHRMKLVQRAHLLTKKRKQLPLCAFCRNNGEPAHIYTSHTLRDPFGKVLCPVLRAYTCPRCGAHGDNAHTLTYCPLNKNVSPPCFVNTSYTLLRAMDNMRI